MKVLDQLKRFNEAHCDVDDAVELHAAAKNTARSYADLGLETPEELTEGVKILEKFIKSKAREQLEYQLKLAKQRRASLSTAEEKRAAEDKRIADLEAKLKEPA